MIYFFLLERIFKVFSLTVAFHFVIETIFRVIKGRRCRDAKKGALRGGLFFLLSTTAVDRRPPSCSGFDSFFSPRYTTIIIGCGES